jgi:hypothetical protein
VASRPAIAPHPARDRTPDWSGAPALWFLLILSVTLAYQAVYARTMTRGDWTGLFFSGAAFPVPAEVGGYSYPGSGYDGQMYRLIAHDPLARKGYWDLTDGARYRSRRVLIPLLAALAGGGSPRRVDFAFIGITDLILALGGVCFVRLAQGRCPPLVAAALYLLIPAVVASTDRMVLDGPLMVGFLAVWVLYRDRRTGLLFLVLAMVPLMRETGICVTAGVGLAYLLARKYRHVAATALTLIPSAAWWWFATVHSRPAPFPSLLSIPLVPQVLWLLGPPRGPLAPARSSLPGILYAIAGLCLLIAFAWFGRALWEAMRSGKWDEGTLLILPFALLAACTGSQPIMDEPYAFMRVNSPLLAWAAVRMLGGRWWLAVAYIPACSASLNLARVLPLLRFVGLAPPV